MIVFYGGPQANNLTSEEIESLHPYDLALKIG